MCRKMPGVYLVVAFYCLTFVCSMSFLHHKLCMNTTAGSIEDIRLVLPGLTSLNTVQLTQTGQQFGTLEGGNRFAWKMQPRKTIATS